MNDNSFVIAVASGKGGTGKTTISCALATTAAGEGMSVSLLDCDVEEPNSNLFLKSDLLEPLEVTVVVPEVDHDRCAGCGTCAEICSFNAIVMVKERPMIFTDLCHSCKGCIRVCEQNALIESSKSIGILEEGVDGPVNYIGGRLNVGQAMSPPLIQAVKEHSCESELVVIDSPPGTSCPVIESIKDADHVILVTDTTPFGLNDVKLAVEMVRQMGIPFSVFINRMDSNSESIESWCKEKSIEICGFLPDSRDIARAYAKGDFIELLSSRYSDVFLSVLVHASNKKEVCI